MPEKDWRLERPDFSDREKYEAAGWVKSSSCEGYEVDGKYWTEMGIGSADPFGKIMTVIEYVNEDLGQTALAIDFFDQGVAYISWTKGKLNFHGDAVRVNKVTDDWVLKDIDEEIDFIPMRDKVNGKEIITAMMLNFIKKMKNKMWEISFSRQIKRED